MTGVTFPAPISSLLPSFVGDASLCLWPIAKGVEVRKFPPSTAKAPPGAI
jgi:hypothetical protein